MSIHTEDIKGEVEREIADKEYNLKKQKIAKGKAAAKAKPAAAPSTGPAGPLVVEVDDDVWSIPSDTEGPAGPKVPKKGKEDDAAKAARKMANERAKLWNTQCGLATKMLAPLSALEKGLGNTLVRYQKLDSFDPTMVDGLKDAANLVARWNHCALVDVELSFGLAVCPLSKPLHGRIVMSKHVRFAKQRPGAKKLINASEEDKVNNDPEGFDTDHAGMTSKLKASKDLMADAKWAVKTEKAEQAAKPKAPPKVKTAPKRKAKTGGA